MSHNIFSSTFLRGNPAPRTELGNSRLTITTNFLPFSA